VLIQTGDVLAGLRLHLRPSCLGGDAIADGLQLATSQRVDQARLEADTTLLAFGKTLTNEVLGAPVHGVAHLAAEAAAERRRLSGDILPIEPCGAGRGDLAFNVEVGAHGDCHAALAAGVIEFAKLDD
jgi:hypothetical protein